jgi:branched-chain amino acid transport system permease protein
VLIGNQLHGLDLLIYGALLVLFIIYMPRGILGTLIERLRARG